jgi:hypothetical protein
MRKKIPKCRNLTSIGTMHYFQGYYSSCHILATVSRVAIDFFSPFHICLRAFYVKNAKKDRYCSNANYEVSSIIESQTPDSSFRSGFYYRSTASPKPSSKQSVYPFNFQYPVSSLRSWSSCLGRLPCFPFIYILPSVFPSITCFRRQFPYKMWPIYLTVLLFYFM